MATLLKTLTSFSAERITTTGSRFNSATFFGYSGFNGGVPVNNVSGVYIGNSSTELPIALAAGANLGWELYSEKRVDDLRNYWVQGRSGDAVYVIYNK